MCAGVALFHASRLDRHRPDLRRARRVRRRPRLPRAGRCLACRQSRAQGRLRQRGGVEFLGLADGDNRRAGGRRIALRSVSRNRLWHRGRSDGRRHIARLLDPEARPAGGREKPSMETLFAGFRYIWHEKVVLGAISLDLFAVLLSGAVALLPIYARDILELGPWGLGLLRASPGIGALARRGVAHRPSYPRSCRHRDVRLRRAVRRLHGRVRGLDSPVAVDFCARNARRDRHGERLCARDADPALDAGRGARPRQRRQHGLRRRVERTRRIPRRHHGGADRHGAGRRIRRRRRSCRGRVVGCSLPAAQENPPPAGARDSA